MDISSVAADTVVSSLDLQEETKNIAIVGWLTDFLKLTAEQKYCQ